MITYRILSKNMGCDRDKFYLKSSGDEWKQKKAGEQGDFTHWKGGIYDEKKVDE